MMNWSTEELMNLLTDDKMGRTIKYRNIQFS